MKTILVNTLTAAFARLRWPILAILCGMTQPAWAAYSPEVDRGLTWLMGQVQADGHLASEELSVATPHQARSETASLLSRLSGQSATAVAETLLADPNDVTENLARTLMAGSTADSRFLPLLQSLLAHQNADGGFGGASGHASNPLDTAWALLALKASGSQGVIVESALAYLQSAQQADGAYTVAGRPDTYTTAIVLTALRAHASQHQLTAPLDQSVAYLVSRQDPNGGWGGETFLAALSYLALHDFVAQEPLATAIHGYLLPLQGGDGSWDGDPYTTALVLSALAAMAEPPANPSLAVLRGQVVDAQTGLPLSGVGASLTGSATGSLTTASDGAFVFRDLAPGAYTLQLALAGYGTITATTATSAGQTQDLGVLQLTKSTGASTGTVQGRITDAISGQPLQGAHVTVNGTAAAATDATGQYQIANLTPGALTVEVTMAGYAGAAGTADLVAGGVVVYSPALTPDGGSPAPSATLKGVVTHAASGSPLAGVQITVSGASTLNATTDAAGAFTLEGLNEGLTTVTAALAGYDSVTASAAVVRNSAVTFSPVMYPSATTPPGANTAAVMGVVLDAGTNQPLANVTIRATWGATTQTLQSGTDGRFNLSGITDADVELQFTLAGYQGSTTGVALEPLVETDIGQVRLRKDKVDVLLPDLAVKTVSRQGAVSDLQALTVTGSVTAVVANLGTAGAPAGIRVMAFHDANLSGIYEADADVALGVVTLAGELAPASESQVEIPVEGNLPFRDAPIDVWVDSAQTLTESNEDNNVNSTAMAARMQPDIGTFKPVVKWHWSGSNVLPAYRQVMMAPVVIQTNDDNGDGSIDSTDIPDVAFIAYGGTGSDYGDGVLRIVSGKDGRELVTVTDTAYRLPAYAHIAAGDIDGDGLVEMVAPKNGGGLVAFSHDGQVKWVASASAFRGGWSIGGPSLADLDGDGKAEVIYENVVLNNDGTLRWKGAGSLIGTNHPYANIPSSYSVVADINLDGRPEIVAGASAYTSDGTLIWQRTDVGDGFAAMGNFNDDPYPEIALVSRGRLFLLDHNGNVMWGPVQLTGANGGAPTVADLDGDGIPEIGVATKSAYRAYRSDGSLLWSYLVTDQSSGMTGSTVFDFDGDGKAEVAYADEYTLRVFDGVDGSVVFSLPNTSGTAYEYPVAADVDGDNHADLIIVSNLYYGTTPVSTTGVRVLQDHNNAWANTRRIWNQHSYHITNINEDGSVPRVEENSWESHNTYRLNARPGISATAVPDITASYLRVEDHGGTRPSTFTVRIGNAGGYPIDSGTSVAFHGGSAGGTLLGTAKTTRLLRAGEYEDILLPYAPSLAGVAELLAVADDDGTGKHTVDDFDRGNNQVSIPLTSQPESFAVAVVADQPSYGANATAIFTATVANRGSFDGAVNVRFSIESVDGTVVETLPFLPTVTVAKTTSATVTAPWNTGTTLAGTYAVRASLLNADGSAHATAATPFGILVDGAGATSLDARLWTDKQRYTAFDSVRITGRVANTTFNLGLTGLTLNEQVMAPDGGTTDLGTRTLPELSPGAHDDQIYTHLLNRAPAGLYTVTQTVRDSAGQVVETREATFEVLSSAETGAGLTGTLEAMPERVQVGIPVAISYTATNGGNADLAGLPLTVTIIDPAAQQVLAEFSQTTDLAMDGAYAGNAVWKAAGQDGVTLVAVLTATVAGTPLTLAQDNFVLVKPPIELEISQAVSGHARILALASCEDDRDDGHGGHDGHDRTTRSGHGQGDDHHHGYGRERDNAHSGEGDHCHNDDDHDQAYRCDRSRADAMAGLLNGLDVGYHIVTRTEDFESAFRSGRYNVYWLSGKQDKLDNDLAAEVREAIFRGDGLLVDGTHDERNHALDEAAGVSYRGKQGEEGLTAQIDGSWFTPASLATAGRAATMRLEGGSQQASLVTRKGPVPGIVSHGYGAGQSLSFAFDLVESYSQEPAWAGILGEGLSHIVPLVSDPLTGGAYLPILTRIRNLGIATEVRVTAQFPLGASPVGSEPEGASAETPAGTTVTWQFPLAEEGEQDLLLGLTVPLDTGDYQLTTVIETLDGDVATPYEDPIEFAFSVRAQSERLSDAVGRIQAIGTTSHRDRQRRDQALDALQHAQRELAKGDYADAIDALLEAVDRLRDIGSASITEARQAVDWLLKETEARWYRAEQ